MNRIQALRKSVKKYNYFVDNPVSSTPDEFSNCALCDYDEHDKYGCSACPMLDKWPTIYGVTADCEDSNSIWDIWDNYWYDKRTASEKEYTPYDRAFFALLLVEAFEARIIEVYKERK